MRTVFVAGCLEWVGPVNRHGYGHFTIKQNGKWMTVNAHRWIYEAILGELPPEQLVRHGCDNRKCVLLQHLDAGSHAMNAQDAISRGRQAIGTAMPHAKLNEDRVRLIHKLHADGWSQQKIANHLGNVSRELVRDIIAGKRWKHVK